MEAMDYPMHRSQELRTQVRCLIYTFAQYVVNLQSHALFISQTDGVT